MKRILLTTVFRPYASRHGKYNKEGDEEWLDYFYSRLTKERGPFAMSTYPTGTTLPLMAANLDADVTVLFHPSMEEYAAELQQGYDFVGISFDIKGLGKLFPMIAAARRHAPGSKVVIGGFGTMLHNLSNTGADFLCKGEGVRFMRNLIGQDPEDPRRQPLVVTDMTLKLFRDLEYLPRTRVAQLTHGFGCPRRCDFCTTSAYYGYRHIPFATGRAMYDAMCEVWEKARISSFWLFEEEMALYRDSVREWGSLIRQDAERLFSWACFTSAKSLEKWDLEELVSMGLSHAWVGVESIESPYAKNKGTEMVGLFADLHELGITTTGSIIFGLDHHTPRNLPKEIDHFISLYPTTTQIGTLMPADGTDVRRRMDAAGRIRPASYKDADLYAEILIHPEFREGELREWVFRAYDRFYEETGPAVHRSARVWLQGARRLKTSSSEVLRRRAALLGRRARMLRPIFLETLDYLPNDSIRESVRDTLGLMRDEFGPPSASEEEQGRLVARLFALDEARRRIYPYQPVEPRLLTRRWIRGEEVLPPGDSPVRLLTTTRA